MDPQKNGDSSKDFGKVVEALHNKQKLPSLRSYQGDMAEFIKNKNESVISIAVKEKERKEERLEMPEKEKPAAFPKPAKAGFKVNFAVLALSLLLIGGGLLASYFVYQFWQNRSLPATVVLKEKILPYNHSIDLKEVSRANFESQFRAIAAESGITVINLSDERSVSLKKSRDFFNALKTPIRPELDRTLRDDFVLGLVSQSSQSSAFLIITVNDFGQAFSGMLDWESSLEKDLSFLAPGAEIASSSASSTPAKSLFSWKDIIIKNKDTRALVNSKGRSRIAYTFLDKNTVLLIGDISLIGEISSAYASRAVAR